MGVVEPDSSWPLVPAVLLVAFVPVQTWVGVLLALRVRARRGRAEWKVVEGGVQPGVDLDDRDALTRRMEESE